MMKRFIILLTGLLLGLGVFAKERPNFLIIMADDCTYNDLPLYGGQNAKTPNINRLAARGLTFNRAYLGEAMCQPCRSELFTAQYAMRNGCAWNHSASRPGLTSMPHHLGALGYRVGLAGKVHVKPQAVYPFQPVEGFDPNCVRNPTRAHEVAGITKFMGQGEEPFCLVVALVEPHVPWVMGDASKYPPQQLKLPPNLADTPRTRVDFSKYLAEITYMDGQVGEILTALESTGKARDTLVLFTSEQGSQFPGCKWTNWNTGLHTALVAHWPGRTPVGQRTDALVQYADILPTLLTAAGGNPKRHDYDGTSFLSVLEGKAEAHRRFVYGIHNNLPEGPSYPIRSVSDGTFHYIRNLRSDELYIEKHLMGGKGDAVLKNPYWQTWMREAWTNPHTYQMVKRYMHRPPEELYNSVKDPYELTNLANTPRHAKQLNVLSAELDRWLAEQGDPGSAVDMPDALKAAREGKHLHGPKPRKTD